jgi:hypothetical protein
VRCRNSRPSELPTYIGTPRPSRLLKTSRWLLVIHTGHVRYDQNSKTSKSVEVRDVETPDPCQDSRPTSGLPTNQPEKNNLTAARQIPDTSGIARPATNQLALLSLKFSKLTWVGLSTYETLSINMMHPS